VTGHIFTFTDQVCDDLVAMKIEVDPGVAGSTFRAAEQLAVKAACGGEIVHGEGEMKGVHFFSCLSDAELMQ